MVKIGCTFAKECLAWAGCYMNDEVFNLKITKTARNVVGNKGSVSLNLVS